MDNSKAIPGSLKDGLRVISCVRRRKDGGSGKEYKRHLQDFVSRNVDEWNECVSRMIDSLDDGCRIYCSVNRRDAKKATKLLIERAIEASFSGGNHLEYFISHPLSEGVSALMNPSSASEKLFLFDCDEISSASIVRNTVGEHIISELPTKNGVHFITRPFNPSVIGELPNTELKRDALYLVAWN